MSVEQLFGVVVLLVAAVYAGLLYEIRKLRKAKHRQAQYIQYCCLCIGIIANHLDIELPEMKERDE